MSYTKVFEPLYEDGWEDLPIEETPITAEAFNDYDEAITHIEGYLEDVDPNANLADEYDSTSTYDLGDYVIYAGVLYKCTTAISTAEDWDSTHWTSCLVTDEMATSGGTTVVANPSGTATETLTKLQVENTIYGVSGGGGNTNMWTGTQAEYTQQASQIADGTLVNITDDEEHTESFDVYNTNEREIGQWIDGSAIYRKVIQITSSISLTADTWVSTGISATNIGMILKGTILNDSPAELLVSTTVQSSAWSVNSPRSLSIDPNSRDWYLIVEYTKSSS